MAPLPGRRARWPADGSSRLSQCAKHLLQSVQVYTRADLKALSGGQDQLHRLTSLLAHRGGLHQGKAHWLDLPLQPLPPCIKRRAAYSVLLTETPLPSSHFAADGQSTRPSASFAPPPAPGCSCHHYAPINSLRASGVHRMLTLALKFSSTREARLQFSEGLSTWSITSTSTGPLAGTSLKPSCS
jgi:hypothetical protein